MKPLDRFRAHVRGLWPKHPLLPVAPFVAYVLLLLVRADLRVEIVLAAALVAVLAYTNAKTKALLVAVYPFGLVGLLYDGMRPFQTLGLTPERVHACDVRDIESHLFGFERGGARATLHDWFLVHHAPAVDLFAAVPYATFVLACVGCALLLLVRDPVAMRRFTWGFFLLNVAGFVTYHAFPAAPPWYVHAHGCMIDLATRASEGPALARVDAMLGVPYFHGMYAKASSVFGAMPSLHCAYPLLIVLEGWRAFGPKLRAAAIFYWAAMVFSAVYLDHHWVLDALAGATYAVVASAIVRFAFARRSPTSLTPSFGAAAEAE